jgi:uncharacterized protein YdhG (YjbR/CyaY superfamily)
MTPLSAIAKSVLNVPVVDIAQGLYNAYSDGADRKRLVKETSQPKAYPKNTELRMPPKSWKEPALAESTKRKLPLIAATMVPMAKGSRIVPGMFSYLGNKEMYKYISDKAAKMKPNAEELLSQVTEGGWPKSQRMADVYDHPELYREIPELMDVPVSNNTIGFMANVPKDGHASFTPQLNSYGQKGSISLNRMDNIREDMIHEVQHAVDWYKKEPNIRVATQKVVADPFTGSRQPSGKPLIAGIHDNDAWRKWAKANDYYRQGHETRARFAEVTKDMPLEQLQRTQPVSLDSAFLDPERAARHQFNESVLKGRTSMPLSFEKHYLYNDFMQ